MTVTINENININDEGDAALKTITVDTLCEILSGDVHGLGEVILTPKCKTNFNNKLQMLCDVRRDTDGAVHYVFDFDRTVTKATKDDGSVNPSSYCVLENAKWIPKDILTIFNDAYDYYSKMEFDPHVDAETKESLNKEWADKNESILLDVGLTRERLASACREANTELRGGCVAHLRRLLADGKDHVTILTAGVADVVDGIFDVCGLPLAPSCVIGNRIVWEDGLPNAVGWKKPRVTPENKASHTRAREESLVPKPAITVLVGDNVHDAKMILTTTPLCSVGLYNHTFPPKSEKDFKLLETYTEAFDVIVARSNSWAYVEKISEALNQC
eukprot:GHVH01011795.1.p1 GENE.GHVH01011795.1~~GHVH01011795.1.p1  ORF type:complete len:338 (+),score=41.72 GHVH01011795.1:25-1014(+)